MGTREAGISVRQTSLGRKEVSLSWENALLPQRRTLGDAASCWWLTGLWDSTEGGSRHGTFPTEPDFSRCKGAHQPLPLPKIHSFSVFRPFWKLRSRCHRHKRPFLKPELVQATQGPVRQPQNFTFLYVFHTFWGLSEVSLWAWQLKPKVMAQNFWVKPDLERTVFRFWESCL